jgi:rhodanese-related sulfurtransferase
MLQKKLNKLGYNKLIITACGSGGGRSIKVAQQLTENGYCSKLLCGGTFGWNTNNDANK